MRRTPRQSRVLGLWTASWLFALLLVLVLRLGDLAVQWPVLLVPVLWALIALRPRRGAAGAHAADRRPPVEPPDHRRPLEPPDHSPPAEPLDRHPRPEPPERRLPPTLEMPRRPDFPRDRREE